MKTDSFPYAFFQGKIVPLEEAKVSIMTNALQYGTAFFGGIRGYYNKEKNFISVFRIDDHYKRFLSSAKILGCEFPYSQEELKKITLELIEKNKPKTNKQMDETEPKCGKGNGRNGGGRGKGKGRLSHTQKYALWKMRAELHA